MSISKDELLTAWTEYAEYANASSIDEAYYTHLVQKYAYLESKYLEKLPFVVERLRAAGISTNSELSRYIKDNRLGDEFPDIIGIVTMSDGRNQWEYDGGVSPQMYRVLCQELGFDKPKSDSRVETFESYADKKRSQD